MNESRSIRTWSIYRTKDTSGSSMNAISFGFVATAILILMFIIMAILEHLFRSDHSSSYDVDDSSQFQKLAEKASMVPVTTSDVSVVMPGDKLPSYVALPAPFPCRREGIRWPSHL
ncbi:hypothetical protein AtNW77_Chr1g0057901 [Arabidopsis thaliana]|uniref:Transmembrane protein n=5 Tax=Arabidopsis TaxID=3701 RepID=A0A384KI31_ARATH|nr:multidrug resistance protein [Arabidopsis thaliana]NP_001322790.1 multidrug resistance protein [Arabidopsis thaliana]NP_001322791.1 multidrug resistance protein [Arabidopsis thaliana]KAG7649918.1 hypothetical protein ISN45_At01g049220 [Arabidopsis thaliana x Arabidopsis arenosa]KAG7657793.1 hypothetical protein ISN44_As01g048290 [Arabidopsis suecica]ABF59180.1 unknown protein [Arabidopsis thaliana]AEE33484.1 multidrug resistance protein [Arabidopsis thaliana]ANM60509.1 multidrug resistanc|eukprot:NP_001117511.1 multidrug resistance protein [Arabidopsis thaliana]